MCVCRIFCPWVCVGSVPTPANLRFWRFKNTKKIPTKFRSGQGFEGVLKEMHFYFNCERLSDYFSNSGFGKSRFYIAGFAYVCLRDLPYNLLINVYACARVQNEADVSDYIFSLKENSTRLYIKSYRRNSFTRCTTLTVFACCYMGLFCNDLNFYMWLNFCSSLRLV